ncbi:MAG: hypothetical protein CMG59_00100 [Candidatus Marinimicrobia bacterium]|nr:hypothetical protein [Candidatus Neomarinimicrobiota bacterium]|tara:strand:- start:4074 stop:4688 length:615 start_codon:yes stop_codon:yes gene_type:complete
MDDNVLKKSIKHLSKNLKIKDLIDKYPYPEITVNCNYFDALSKIIIYQQLNGKVSNIIYTRFQSLFKNKVLNPHQYLKLKNSELRNIGLSTQKIKYIRNLSDFFINKGSAIQFNTASIKEISKELIIIKGIGQWTIDIFMMSALFKTDILPLDDLGIKKGFKKLYNLSELPSEAFMKKTSLEWRPYRTIVSYYLWMLSDDNSVT